MKRLADNEFSEQFTGDMESADTMYHHYQKDYRKQVCIKCGLEFWRLKSEPVESDLCGVCIRKGIK